MLPAGIFCQIHLHLLEKDIALSLFVQRCKKSVCCLAMQVWPDTADTRGQLCGAPTADIQAPNRGCFWQVKLHSNSFCAYVTS